jgi:hypothetical protein
MWATTSDAARMLDLTVWGVRWLARHGGLPSERTVAGQWLFRLGDVLRLVERRASARLTGRVRADGPIGEPRQLSLFGKARLRLVGPGPGESALSDRGAKGSGSRNDRAEFQ